MSDNVKKVMSLYEAFGRGDIATIVDNVSEGVTWGTETAAKEIPWYNVRRGPAGVGEFFSVLDREAEFTQFAPALFVGEKDEVLVCVELTYRIKKNGRTASMGSVHRFKIRDGKVASFRVFEDTAAVREAWGA
jgi:uncharacterized protein